MSPSDHLAYPSSSETTMVYVIRFGGQCVHSLCAKPYEIISPAKDPRYDILCNSMSASTVYFIL